jgi:integrase
VLERTSALDKDEIALVLAEATGRRIGAIRQLRWEDVSYGRADITWRADADTIGMLWVIPLTTTLVAELRHFQKKLGAEQTRRRIAASAIPRGV